MTKKNFYFIILSLFTISIAFYFFNTITAYIPTYDLKIGQITDKDIIAPYTFNIYKTREELKKEQDEIIKNTPPVYFVSSSLTFNAIKNLDFIFGRISELSKQDPNSIQIEMSKLGFNFSLDTIKYLLDPKKKSALYTFLSEKINHILNIGIYDSSMINDNIELIKDDQIKVYHKKRLFSLAEALNKLLEYKYGTERNVIREIANYVLITNIVVNKQETQKKIESNFEKISPFKGKVLRNELIIGKNKKITEDVLNIIHSMKIAKSNISENSDLGDLKVNLGQFSFFIIIYFSLYYSLHYIFGQHTKESKQVYLIFGNLSVAILLMLFLKFITDQSYFYLPYAFFVLIIGLIISAKVGFVFNVFLLISVSQLSGWSIFEFSAYALSSIIVLLSIHLTPKKHSYFLLGFMLIVATIIIILINSLTRAFSADLIFDYILYGLLSNLISIFALILLIPFVEKQLAITTNETLLSLIDYNKNNLIKRLSTIAPGTYYHSINVAGLAENMAEAIGANTILTRVGSYYHDIGKLDNSDFFIENNAEAVSKHELLNPTESAQIIKSHIVMGVAMAKKNKIPQEVIDIIKQHHGNSKVRFFFYKAKENGMDVDESHFEYPGPIPQTKEAALVMIADIIESTAKSQIDTIKKFSSKHLQQIIDKTIDFLIQEKQLIDSGLTFKDIEIIKKSLLNSMEGIYGTRIEYPEDIDNK